MNQFNLATVAFTVALAIHGTDHVIRGADAVQPLVMWSGTLQAILGIAVLSLVLREHGADATAATLLGFGSVLRVSARGRVRQAQ